MNKQILALSVAAIFSGISLAQAEVTLFDYQEASSAYEDAYIDGALNIGKGSGDDQTSYNFDIVADYERVISSPLRDWKLDGRVEGKVKRDGTEDADSVDTYDAEASLTADSYFASGSNGGFWYGSAQVRDRDDYDNIASEASIGLGYGRVTDVTPMAQAIRVVDELSSRNLLSARPSKAVYQEMANIISRDDEYRSRYGAGINNEYEIRWIGDIESVLVNAGVLKSTGAASSLYIRKVLLDENTSTRRLGWKVRGGVGYVFSTASDEDDDSPKLELGAEYHMPLSNQAQFSEEATASIRLQDGEDSYEFNNAMSYTYELGDLLDWENRWNFQYRDPSEKDDVTTNQLSSSVAYELNNTLDLVSGISFINVDGGVGDGHDTNFTTSLRYRLR